MEKLRTIYEGPKDSEIEKFAKDFNDSLENIGFHCEAGRKGGEIYHSSNPSAPSWAWCSVGEITQVEIKLYTSNRKVHKFIRNYNPKTERRCEENGRRR